MLFKLNCAWVTKPRSQLYNVLRGRIIFYAQFDRWITNGIPLGVVHDLCLLMLQLCSPLIIWYRRLMRTEDVGFRWRENKIIWKTYPLHGHKENDQRNRWRMLPHVPLRYYKKKPFRVSLINNCKNKQTIMTRKIAGKRRRRQHILSMNHKFYKPT